MRKKRKLPRLDPQFYRGEAYVFWTHTTECRAKFPEGPLFLASFREWLCHVCARYLLMAPVYCLMPDHLHLLWIGVHPESGQRNATKCFRRILGLSWVLSRCKIKPMIMSCGKRNARMASTSIRSIISCRIRFGPDLLMNGDSIPESGPWFQDIRN